MQLPLASQSHVYVSCNQHSEEPRAVASVGRKLTRLYLLSLFTLQHSALHTCLPTYFDDHPAVIILNPTRVVIPLAAATTTLHP